MEVQGGSEIEVSANQRVLELCRNLHPLFMPTSLFCVFQYNIIVLSLSVSNSEKTVPPSILYIVWGRYNQQTQQPVFLLSVFVCMPFHAQ